MLHFILGRAGSGKSTYVFEKIKETLDSTDCRVVLMVPEQFSFESERKIYKEFNDVGIQRIEVLSFQRLANSIFRKYGGLAGSYAEEPTKIILMNLALEQIADRLRVYHKSSGVLLTKSMLDMVNEFKTWGITEHKLQELEAQLEEGHLKDKLGELSLIYSVYEALLNGVYLDPLDDISRAAEMLRKNRYFENTVVYLDEFDGFTANEIEILKAIFTQAKEVFLSLCLSGTEVSDRAGLFAPVKKTFNRVLRLARECGAAVAVPTVLEGGKRFSTPEIAHLERNVLAEHIDSFQEEPKHIRIFSAADEYDEVDFVLATIKNLVREGQYRYRDIMIIARDLKPYQNALQNGFSQYRIPFFADMLGSVTEKPLIRFTDSLLKATVNSCNVNDILNLLKCGILDFSAEDISRFENYIYTWDIKGSGLKQEFTAHPRGYAEVFEEADIEELAFVNRLRQQVVDTVTELQARCEQATGAEISAVLYQLLERLQVRENVQKTVDHLNQMDMPLLAAEYRQTWEVFVQILDALAISLENTVISLKRYAQLYQLVADTYRIGEIPQQLDCVSVGTSDRSRMANPRVVFVLGANDGVFPYVPSGSGLLTDGEKQQLAAFDIQLSRNSEEMILQERFLAYKALTCAGERLFVSYRRASVDGKPLAPSFIVNQLLMMFGRECKYSDGEPDTLYYCQTEQTVYSRFAECFKQDTPLRAAMEEYLNRYGYAERVQKLYEAASNKEYAVQDSELAKKLFGSELHLSASKFERYQNCRFLYFCSDGLKAKPRKRAELNPLETGVLIHDVIYQLMSDSQLSLCEMEDSALKSFIRARLDEYIATKMGGAQTKTKRFLYLYHRISNTLFQIISHLREEARQSQFVPTDFELQIGRGGSVQAKELIASDGTKIMLEGRIDRVDTYEKDGVKYVRVIDYKTGTKEFKLSDVIYGLNMQMLLYLFSIWDTPRGKYRGSIPAGILYMPAKAPKPSLGREAEQADIEAQLKKSYCMNGLLLDDEEVLKAMDEEIGGVFIPVKRLAKEKVVEENGKERIVKFTESSPIVTLGELGKLKRYTESLICDMVRELHRGSIEAVPLSGGSVACSYCDFRSVCNHQETDRCREMQKFKNKQAVLTRIEEVLADE